jgi:hypothetical protein
MAPEIFAVILTSAFAAFTGVAKALSNFNEKIQERFLDLQEEIDRVEDNMLRDYVLKQDFIREMMTVNQKLDHILEMMLKAKN